MTPVPLSDLLCSYRSYARVQNGKPANLPNLTKTQQTMLNRFNGARLGFVSSALIFDTAVRRLSKPEHRALIQLIRGNVLRVYRVNQSLSSVVDCPAHQVGANAECHYLITSVREPTQ